MQNNRSIVVTVGGPKLQLLKCRWLLFLSACFVLLFPSQLVSAEESDDTQTVYHVYMGDKHIGAVEDKDVVEELIADKIKENEKEYSHLTLTAGEDISYIEEKSFHPDYNEDEVREKIKQDVDVKAKAQALEIDGEVVGYFKNKQTVTKLLKAYQAKYVDKNTIDKLDEQDNDIGTYQLAKEDKKEALKPGDSRVANISFSKDVSISEETVAPDKVLTKKKGLKLLKKGTLEEEVHHVEDGEVLESIADDYDLSIKEIVKLNPDIDEDSVLQIDQGIHVTAHEPYMDVLVEKERMDEEKISFDKKVEKTDDLYKGEKEVVQKGSDGKEDVHYTTQEKNGEEVDEEETDHHVVKEPKEKIVKKGTKIIPSRGTGDLIWPVDGGSISSQQGTRWGKMHKGIDIAGPNSRTISAADNGVITEAGHTSGGYGNKIVIDHNNGMKTIYAHLDSIDVDVGQTVEQGHSIGVMGSTGHSTGLHLHFEVHENGDLKNPTEYVQQ